MLAFRIEEAQHGVDAALPPALLDALLPDLRALLRASGEERAAPALRSAKCHCRLTLTLPPGYAPPPAEPIGDDEGAVPLPAASQRHLELAVLRRAGAGVTWESALVAEQRNEGVLTAAARAGDEASASAWRLPPIDAMLLMVRAVAAVAAEGAWPPAFRAFRRRALDLEEQRARVRAGGEAWSRVEQLRLLCRLRLMASGLPADGGADSAEDASIRAAFECGERAMAAGGAEGEEGGSSGGDGGGGEEAVGDALPAE